MMASLFVGLGPGGLKKFNQGQVDLNRFCLPGSNHGGNVRDWGFFKVDAAYDKNDLTTFHGGSGGDVILLLCFYLFSFSYFITFFNLSFLLAFHVLSWPKPAKYFHCRN